MDGRARMAGALVLGMSVCVLPGCSTSFQNSTPAVNSVSQASNQTTASYTGAPHKQAGSEKMVTKATDVTMTDVQHGWLVTKSTNGNVLYTDDGGYTWRDVTPPNVGASTNVSVSLADVINTKSAMVRVSPLPSGFPSVLYQTSDGGQHWSKLNLPRQYQNDLVSTVHFCTLKVGWVILTPRSSKPGETSIPLWIHTTDAGATWNLVHTTNNPQWLRPGNQAATSQSGTKFYVFAPNQMMSTADGGNTWTSTPVPNPSGKGEGLTSGLRILCATFFGPNRGLIVEDWPSVEDVPPAKLAVLSTRDNGKHWTMSKVLHLSQNQSGQVADAQILGPDNVVVVNGSTVYHTADGGEHWRSITNTITVPSLWQVHFVNDETAFGAANGHPVKTTDGGQTWYPVQGKFLRRNTVVNASSTSGS